MTEVTEVEKSLLCEDIDTSIVPEEHMYQVAAIAKMCHEVIRAYSLALREEQPSWDKLTQEAKDVVIGRVAFHILYPDGQASGAHDSWMLRMQSQGWKYGKVKDEENKLHPNIKPFHHLPTEQQAKDYIFKEIVHQAINS